MNPTSPLSFTTKKINTSLWGYLRYKVPNIFLLEAASLCRVLLNLRVELQRLHIFKSVGLISCAHGNFVTWGHHRW